MLISWYFLRTLRLSYFLSHKIIVSLVLSTREPVWLPDSRPSRAFSPIYLYSIAFSVVSADTREAECNFIARLEHWKVIVDFPLLSGCILVLCSIIRKLNPWSILNCLDNIPSVYGIILSGSLALTQLFWDFGFKYQANFLDLCVNSRVVSGVL